MIHLMLQRCRRQFNDYDVIDGGDGTDTLTIKELQAAGGTTLIPQLSNIEIIQVTNNIDR